MKLHWKVLLWMLAGAVVGLVMQKTLDAPATAGATWQEVDGGIELVATAKAGPAVGSKLDIGDVVYGAIRNQGSSDPDRPEERFEIATVADFDDVVERSKNGDVLRLDVRGRPQQMLALSMVSDSPRAKWIYPFSFLADIFMALLKMLIVPIVFTSITTGVAGVGKLSELRRLGAKTFGYYIATSLLAILVGQALVTTFRPGDGAQLGLTELAADEAPDTDPLGILQRIVPENIVSSMTDNTAMLQVIFFALLLGLFITRTPDPYRERILGFFEAFFQVMLKMAEGVLSLLPYGVFCLLVRVVAKTGFAVFEPLLMYMAIVTAALAIHACVTLPIILRVFGRMSPYRWAKAMSPALITAFSTSSSNLTLPVTLETVEKRGKVSNKITSFTLPLGATINMDGTALYECIGVIFLAQYYATTSGYELTLGAQGLVVLMALLASIGAAGIPSAGLVMMLTILAALGLPLEGAALLLAVDRPLDMLRTMVNVWSDSCAAAVIARSEGEEGPLHAGAPG
ncbi:MAG: dicarboxylate/amino acid:cation symporter [Planctomycetota bacterium]|nr:dicarboxylate/amino acid:cation symporter [Planctomycetota bacterium]